MRVSTRVNIRNRTQCDSMKPLAVARICAWSCLIALSISGTAATGQSEDPGQPDPYGSRQPLHSLPPIVADSNPQPDTRVKSVKKLFLPPIVSGKPKSDDDLKKPVKQLFLPPIVSTGKAQASTSKPAPLERPQTLPPAAMAGRATVSPRSEPLRQVSNANVPVSQAGVPLYTRDQQAVLNQSLQQAANQNRVGTASFNQSGGTAPPIVQGTGNAQSLPPVVLPDSRQSAGFANQDLPMVDPANSTAPGSLPSNIPDIQVESPAPVFEPAPSSGTPGTNDYFDNNQTAPVVNGQAATAGAGCSTCGPNGCYDLDQVQAQMGCCGAVVSAGYYVFTDFLGYSRGDGDVQLSTFAGLNDFGIAGGLRVTLGYRRDATSGRELTYLGTGKIGESVLAEDANNGLFPTFQPGGGFNFGDVSSFFNAFTHYQTKSSQIHSIEYNRVEWAWDLLKTIVGFRYILFRDDYLFWSANPVSNGLYTMNIHNNLFGLNLGYELFYDVGYRTSFSFTNRYGLFINAGKVDTNLFNDDERVLEQETSDSTFASAVDFSLMGHFQLAPRARLRASADVLLMWGVYTVENNAPRTTTSNGVVTALPVITPMSGAMLNTTNQPVFFNGFSFGFEFFR